MKATDDKLAEMRVNLEAAVQVATEAEAAKQAVQVVLEDNERSRGAKVEAIVKEAINQYISSEDFTVLLDKEVGLEMVDLIYRFKCFIPGKKLNLNFVADFPSLPKEITEEMVEEYEGEDTLPKPSTKVVSSYAADGPVNAVV